jgi:hypothetical protein
MRERARARFHVQTKPTRKASYESSSEVQRWLREQSYDVQQPDLDIPLDWSAALLQALYEYRSTQQLQEIPLPPLRYWLAFALNLPAPFQYFLVFLALFISVNLEYDNLGSVIF